MKRINLVSFRLKHGLTQREMAEKLGISKNHYANIECCIFDPSYKVMQKFSEAFAKEKVDVWDVFKKEEITKGGGTIG